jgi:hypothetical protein
MDWVGKIFGLSLLFLFINAFEHCAVADALSVRWSSAGLGVGSFVYHIAFAVHAQRLLTV